MKEVNSIRHSTWTKANGDEYVGGWKDNAEHGQGILTYADGTVVEGLWNEGQAPPRTVTTFVPGVEYAWYDDGACTEYDEKVCVSKETMKTLCTSAIGLTYMAQRVTTTFDEVAGGSTLDLSGITVSSASGVTLTSNGGASADVPACEDVDSDGVCDSGDDCVGEYDECGVCNGDGIADGACDCDGNVDLGCGCGEAGPSGCDNACGSDLVDDECGICGGDGIADGACAVSYTHLTLPTILLV